MQQATHESQQVNYLHQQRKLLYDGGAVFHDECSQRETGLRLRKGSRGH